MLVLTSFLLNRTEAQKKITITTMVPVMTTVKATTIRNVVASIPNSVPKPDEGASTSGRSVVGIESARTGTSLAESAKGTKPILKLV